MKEMKPAQLMFRCVILGLSCPIWKMEILPAYLAEGGTRNQILSKKNPIDLKIHLIAWARES